MSGPPPGIDGRSWHYRDFYGVDHNGVDHNGVDHNGVDHNGVGHDGVGSEPLLLVYGNCQAEALRVLLAGAIAETGIPLRTVRVPAVHELTAADVDPLSRLLPRCAVVVAQPVRDGYRDLPLGTAQVLAQAPTARVVMFPVVRDGRLRPTQALVRVPGAGEPPVVPYHDLRTLALAADRLGSRPLGPVEAGAPLPPDGVRRVAERAQTELRRRQDAHGTLAVADLLEAAGADASHTLNHPGNAVLVPLAQRVLDALGLDAVATDPGRVLLRAVIAPLEAEVLRALGLPGQGRADWVVAGRDVTDEVVRDAQLAWYAANPDVVRVGVERHEQTMADLGL